jgi:protein gp37
MAEMTKISWADATFNPWIGCQKVSRGCVHCYAEELMDKRYGRVQWGPTGTRVRTAASNWRQPLRWNRQAFAAGERKRVFCSSLADVFEDRPELDTWRRDLAQLITATPHLDWLLLTKRPENAKQMIYEMWFPDAAWPKNYWLGTSVEDRKSGLPRIDVLRGVPAPLRFLSVEPLVEDIGPIDLSGIGWVIVGGESGAAASPMHPAWARSVRDQCIAAGVPFLFKQWGQWSPIDQPWEQDSPKRLADNERWCNRAGGHGFHGDEVWRMRKVGKESAGAVLDGREWHEFPAGHLKEARP